LRRLILTELNADALKSRDKLKYFLVYNFVIGSKSFSIMGVLILLIQWRRGQNLTEGPDKLIYLMSFGTILFFLFAKFQIPAKFVLFINSMIASIVFLLGVYGIEDHGVGSPAQPESLWLGFGPYVVLAIFLLLPFTLKFIEWYEMKRRYKIFFSSVVILNLVCVVLSFYQTSKSLISVYHTEYVLNEVIAVSDGRWPYSNFIPQYQTFYGFLLRPFSSLMSSDQLSSTIFFILFLLSLLSLALATYFSWLALGRRSLILAIALTIPLAAVTQFPIRRGYEGSISALFSAVPIRIFSGILVLGTLILMLERIKSLPFLKRCFFLCLFGNLLGISAWQSQDFGIAAVATSFIIVLVSGSERLFDFKSLIPVFVGFFLGFAYYPIIAFLNGHPVNFAYYGFFVRQIGNNFGAEAIRTPGPILVVLTLLVLLVVIHGRFYLGKRDLGLALESFRLSSLIGLTFAIWSLLSFT
jgi:hypothetical protein